MNKQLVLGIGLLLILVGMLKPNLSNFPLGGGRPVSIDVLELPAPTEEALLKEATDVVNIIKNNMPKQEARKLRDLYLDIGQLVKLDGEDQVIKNTEEIRQVNSIAGPMLKLDIKGKYPNLANEAKEVIVAAIGDDNIVLSPELRAKGVDGFSALAWAYNEASK